MGKILSLMYRPFRDFNLESRAHKVIGKDKPTSAPKFKSDELEYKRMLQEQPKLVDDLKKDEILNKFLRNVYVTSQDPTPQQPVSSSSADRPLPLNRNVVVESDFGFREPDKVSYGRVTLKSALRFIAEHQSNPTARPIADIVEQYKLPEETVRNIIKYFRVYEIYIPTKKADTTFVGPIVPRIQVITHETKKIGEGEKK